MTSTTSTLHDTDEQVVIPVGHQQLAIVDFIHSSALEFCTDLHVGQDGSVTVRPSWPTAGFSHGERILWNLLDSLVRGQLAETYMRLDAHNLAAFAALTSGLAEAVKV